LTKKNVMMIGLKTVSHAMMPTSSVQIQNPHHSSASPK
jgi:hypothetical protein